VAFFRRLPRVLHLGSNPARSDFLEPLHARRRTLGWVAWRAGGCGGRKPAWTLDDLVGFLQGVAVSAVAISCVALLRVAPGAFRSRPSVGLALAAFIANAVLHINILWVMGVLVPIGMWLESRETQ
jgi:hypothetical protein